VQKTYKLAEQTGSYMPNPPREEHHTSTSLIGLHGVDKGNFTYFYTNDMAIMRTHKTTPQREL